MNTNKEKIIHKKLSYKIVGLALELHNTLGPGFLEKVYENALMVLFRREKIQAQQQTPIRVFFEGQKVGEYCADILVERKIILELKAADQITETYRAQVLNYLRATNLRLGIILSFAKPSFEYARIVL